ncbi:tRNA methyltransferase, has a role in tRNA modification [Actinomortierella wolfii]|nr:tRNA methyltransferase, has a role in tRNA modification [Actinomortierella wolfii]
MSKAKNPLHVPSPFLADNVGMTEAQQEEEHVHNVYQAIASHFSATRYKDFAISIAVIHHFVSPERRLAAVEEILRIVRPGGRILIFVWALEQSGKRDFDKNVQDVFVPWALPEKPAQKKNKVPKGRGKDTKNSSEATQTPEQESSPSPAADAEKQTAAPSTPSPTTPETTDSSAATKAPSVFKRYYHLFREGELEELVLSTGKVKIERKGYDRDNWWCIVEKTLP